jgi:hypothetical protein
MHKGYYIEFEGWFGERPPIQWRNAVKYMPILFAFGALTMAGFSVAAQAAPYNHAYRATAPEMRPGGPDVAPFLETPEERQALRGSALVMHSDDGMPHDAR